MSKSEAVVPQLWQTMRFRLLGLLPLSFFLARVIEYVRVGTPEHIMWCCHISNLLLALGIFFAQPHLIRVAAFWLIVGVPPWIADMAFSGLITPVSIYSHLGGFVVALVGLSQVRTKPWSWVSSLIYFLVLQQLTRLVTPPNPYMNVNVAHFAYGPWKDLFSSYWKYWVVNSFLTGLSLWIIEFVMLRIFPEKTLDRPDQSRIRDRS